MRDAARDAVSDRCRRSRTTHTLFMHVIDTRRAMFWAANAAQCAEERYVTVNRIVAALLRTPSVRALCSPTAFVAMDDPGTLSFEECERRVMQDLADKGLELGSKEHQATVQRRHLEPSVKPVFDAILERPEQFMISPLELLLALVRADASLAERLAPHGLTEGTISAALAADGQ